MEIDWQQVSNTDQQLARFPSVQDDHPDNGLSNDTVLRTLVHSISGYLYSVQYQRGNAVFTYHSPQCARITGYGPEEYRIDPDLWLKMVHPGDRDEVLRFFRDVRRLLEGKPLQHRIIHKDGGERWVSNHCTATLDPFGQVARLDGFLIDITDQKTFEESLNMAKEDAEAATRQKDKFVSLVSHDLRAPLASLIGFLRVLANEDLGAEQRKIVGILGNISGNMLKMIDELLSITRLKSGSFHISPRFVDAFAIGLGVMENLIYEARAKGVEVVNAIEPGTRIYADPDLAWEVLQNLISNAVKFSRKGDKVTVFTPAGNPTTIAVKDTGVGIPKDILPHLFSYDVKTSTTGTAGERGTGLGLPLCHDIMAAHGGTLDVETAPGKGTIMRAGFPPVAPVILLVDDAEAHHALMDNYGERLGVKLLHAYDAGEGLRILADTRVHLVISDINMPGMDGFAFLRAVRNNLATKTLPFIMVTAQNEPRLSQKALTEGADDFICLPFSESDLIPRVRRFTV